MEKRFIGFVAASVVIMAGFLLLQMWLGPKGPPKKPIPLADKKIGDDKEAQPAAKKQPDDKQKPAAAGKPEAKPDPENPDVEKPTEPDEPPATVAQPAQEWITLGSIDPKSPYRLLVTFNNRGGAIERIELSSRDYVDLEDRSGYLGHLASITGPNDHGCVVSVVGAGTPAALATAKDSGLAAGLQPGDVILSFDAQEVTSPADLVDLLQKTKPGQQVEIVVSREVAGRPAKLQFVADLIRRPMEIVRPEWGTSASATEQHPLSLLLSLYSIGAANEDGTASGTVKVKRGEREIAGLPSLEEDRWKVVKISNKSGEVEAVEFHFTLDEGQLKKIGQTGQIEIIKRYRLAATPDENIGQQSYKSYHLEFELEIVNQGKQAQQIAYQLSGPNGLPLEGWWYQNKIHPHWASAGARDVVWKSAALERRGFFNLTGHRLMGCAQIYDDAIAKTPKDTVLFGASFSAAHRQIYYAGIDAQFFNTSLIPIDPKDETETFFVYDQGEARPAPEAVKKEKSGRKITNVTFELVSPPTKIAAGDSLKQRFLLFAGPKEPQLLANYHLDETIEYGWFRWVAQPLIKILHFFHWLVGNWGISIIMLTVLVRGCLHPIGRRMAKNMQAMQDLAPEMKALKEKYKDDMAKQGKAQQELFKKHKINPYAGCLPLFLQMPIFIGLYRALSVDIALRQAPLIPGVPWCENLAGPDMLWYWKPYLLDMLAGESGWLGPYLNVLPLVTAGLFLWQQKKFTPPPTDEQQEMQQKMMNFMTLFMSVMFFKVPAGLCIYFITSSLWGLAERTWMMPKRKTGGAEVVAKPGPKKTPDKTGSNGVDYKEDVRKKQRTKSKEGESGET